MSTVRTKNDLYLFQLPEWARWAAWVELNQDFYIQIASLKYPRWDMTFYPVFFRKDQKPLFPFPQDLVEAAQDRRIWHCCPDKLWNSSDSLEIFFESYDEGDHPRAPHAERYQIKPPDYFSTLLEAKTGDYDKDGGAIPRLSPLPTGLEVKQVELLPGVSEQILSKTPSQTPPWPMEKRKL